MLVVVVVMIVVVHGGKTEVTCRFCSDIFVTFSSETYVMRVVARVPGMFCASLSRVVFCSITLLSLP